MRGVEDALRVQKMNNEQLLVRFEEQENRR